MGLQILINDHFVRCWHSRPRSAIIHTQNVTFSKYPGQNIRLANQSTLLDDSDQ